MKKVEYPLMVTTFSRDECKDILHLAINAVLPVIGINHHFPRNMVYGHNNHLGLTIPHLYNSQGFLHLSALLKFGNSHSMTGELLKQSYETLQLEIGLPGRNPSALICRLVSPKYVYLANTHMAIRIGEWLDNYHWHPFLAS